MILICHCCLATGEPAICMAIVVMFALRQAVMAYNRESGDNTLIEFGMLPYVL